ncbi:WGR domain-containing protein [Rhodoblastus acidophilus]|uniref:WGR domain-containing protein n=1 Tax=Candidatus Rhodoblastus alkanivorans TaxID=2954117 RepID=A0ABS9Z2P5_9HYPH|nr:WGR domain-containing protein [Candidatus Rhodoblastus alkanivorans]MCI4679004.1 WGR domain-containing protein [Candidatus Rhodoblastus alkanivorans]MCI4681741.1 WGR domain-containing protein [Candidatus Rhodoblastus alkanivorans]MDI4642790.1 WGR domain-containing protein [Rhodoblastus acidophilus]
MSPAPADLQIFTRKFSEAAHLRRIDPTRNMARFYEVSLEPSLFGIWAVVRRWGRIGCQGRIRLELCESADDAFDCIKRVIAAKRRRGYQTVV